MTKSLQEFNKEKLEEVESIIDKQFGLSNKDGSYIYHLTRVKEAFNIGTMTFDDFKEIDGDDEWLNELKEGLRSLLSTALTEQAKMIEAEMNLEEKITMKIGEEEWPDYKDGFAYGYNDCRQEVLDKFKELNK